MDTNIDYEKYIAFAVNSVLAVGIGIMLIVLVSGKKDKKEN